MKRGVQRMSQLPAQERAWAKQVFASYFDRYEMLLLNGASLAEVTSRKIADERSAEVYEAEKDSGVYRVADATTAVSELPPARVAGRR